MLIGRTRSWLKRWPFAYKTVWARLVCLLRGHDFSPWQIDDIDGPGEHMEGGGFMPYCSRESRPGEFGIRVCRRHCGTSERRWPEADAPALWRAQIDWERRGRPLSSRRL